MSPFLCRSRGGIGGRGVSYLGWVFFHINMFCWPSCATHHDWMKTCLFDIDLHIGSTYEICYIHLLHLMLMGRFAGTISIHFLRLSSIRFPFISFDFLPFPCFPFISCLFHLFPFISFHFFPFHSFSFRSLAFL